MKLTKGRTKLKTISKSRTKVKKLDQNNDQMTI